MKTGKQLFEKYREIILYLFFGVLTTVVGMGSYFLFLKLGTALGFTAGDGEPTYLLRLVAQIGQWVLAVLFAFYTNRKWVFDAEKKTDKNTVRQLAEFSGSRVMTLLLDTAVTLGTVWLLERAGYVTQWIFTPDLIAKLLAAILVVIANYVLSKLCVFR